MNQTERLLQALRQLLLAGDHSLAVAESLTGGRIQSLLTQMSGSSEFFVGGITAYGVTQKVDVLHVDRDVAEQFNGVCEQTCMEMAEGAAELFTADVALATTGYAEPSPGRNVTTPMAYLAVRIGNSIHVERHQFAGERTAVQNAVAEKSLSMLQERLIDC